MGGEVAGAFVSVMPSMKNFGRTVVNEATRSGDLAGRQAGSRFGRFFVKATAGPLRTFGALAGGIFAVKKVSDFFKSTIAEARESQKVSALTAQVIKSTGGAAQISAKQVGQLATSISNKVGVDDEAIQSGANLLLTFKGIRNETGAGNDIFNQTTQIMTDMTAAMNHGQVTAENLKGSAIQLGKALNDPAKGMTALTRVGVTFTDQQQKQVKALVASGDTMKAQKIILRELKSEFGGAAAASTTAGQKLSVVWGNLKERIGTALLPALDRAEKALAKALPKIEKRVTQIAHVISTKIFPKVKDITSRAVGFGAGIVAAVKTAVENGDWKTLGKSLSSGIGKGLRAAFSGGGGLLSHLVDWAKGVDWGDLGIKVGKGAVSFVTGFVVGFIANLPAILSTLAAHWQDAIIAALSIIPIGRVAGVVGKVIERIPILRIFTPLLDGVAKLGGWIETAISKTLGRVFRFFGREFSKGFKSVVPDFLGAARGFVSDVVTRLYVWADDFGKAGVRWVKGLGNGARRAFGAVARWFGRLGGRIVKALGDLSNLLYDAGKAVLQGFWDGMKSVWHGIQNYILGIPPWLRNNKGPIEKDRKLLTPHGIAVMAGFQDGLTTRWEIVKGIILAAGKSVPETFAAGIKSARGILQNELDALKNQMSNVLSNRSAVASGISSTISGFDFGSITNPTADSIADALNRADRGAHRERKLAKALQKRGLPPEVIAAIESDNDPAQAIKILRAILGGDRTTIANIGGAFGDLNLTAHRAGGDTAQAQFAHKLDLLTGEMKGVRQEIRFLRREIGPDVAGALNGATGTAKRKGTAKAST